MYLLFQATREAEIGRIVIPGQPGNGKKAECGCVACHPTMEGNGVGSWKEA
jgi:hypothetical protein